MSLNTERTIAELRSILEQQRTELQRLRLLPVETLHQRPAPKRWSVAEVLEHMNLSSGHYVGRAERIYADPRSRITRSETFEPGRWGEMGVNAMRPDAQQNINWRMKTLWLFEPRTDRVKGHASLDRFDDLLKRTLQILDLAQDRGWDGPRVTSTLGPLLRFKLCDAMRFPVAHQQRHMLQIQRTLIAVGARV